MMFYLVWMTFAKGYLYYFFAVLDYNFLLLWKHRDVMFKGIYYNMIGCR